MNIGYIVAFSLLGVLVIGSFIFALTVSKNEALLKKRLDELERENVDLSDLAGVANKKTISDLPISERLMYPYIMRISNLMLKITPKSYINSLNEKLTVAGNPKNMTAVEFLGITGMFAVVLPVGSTVLLLVLGWPLFKAITFLAIFALVGYLFPKMWLNKTITQRKDQVRKMLPFCLDLLNVSVDAGLGFDSAMDKVSKNMDGVMATEFERVLTEIRLGKQRKDALRNMITRTDVKELNQFVVAIIQADKLGVGLSKLLKVQAKQMRANAKQRAQEKAFKAPVKMLFPMILFIFPSIFVILLGPAALYLPSIFGGM